MRTHKLLILISLTALGMLLPSAVPSAAQATFTQITGTESCSPIDPGTLAFPDGRTHISGLVERCRDESSDPRGTGWNTVVINARVDSDFTGPAWGTFSLLTDEGGVWAGTWEGLLTTTGFELHATGKGEGIYEGMKWLMDYVNGQWQARIIDPRGQ